MYGTYGLFRFSFSVQKRVPRCGKIRYTAADVRFVYYVLRLRHTTTDGAGLTKAVYEKLYTGRCVARRPRPNLSTRGAISTFSKRSVDVAVKHTRSITTRAVCFYLKRYDNVYRVRVGQTLKLGAINGSSLKNHPTQFATFRFPFADT